ncbi:hypothetical protein BU26DRAFT_562313 [Trematosphaeria pertusa]|uniref:Uncharacterized protein n=1 Tax=Trematosphaeria pertusa TaxID=390896 RepID=A0A6A6IQK3_9PLEO|nr:uncharacterized protein BU26DRAFT_562313 [Trematosphaeria pertusa]KAF2252579.1 hypothetical protein BU26DRAFT_562313 [Trematosphaeria pertusa]
MKFTTVVAAVLSMAAFGIAAPVAAPAAEDVAVRQNHGMCVSGSGGTVTQITDC